MFVKESLDLRYACYGVNKHSPFLIMVANEADFLDTLGAVIRIQGLGSYFQEPCRERGNTDIAFSVMRLDSRGAIHCQQSGVRRDPGATNQLFVVCNIPEDASTLSFRSAETGQLCEGFRCRFIFVRYRLSADRPSTGLAESLRLGAAVYLSTYGAILSDYGGRM